MSTKVHTTTANLIDCWSCESTISLSDVSAAGGLCPRCDAEIDIDGYRLAAIDQLHTERDQLRAERDRLVKLLTCIMSKPPRIRGLVDRLERAVRMKIYGKPEDKKQREHEVLEAKMAILRAFALLSRDGQP